MEFSFKYIGQSGHQLIVDGDRKMPWFIEVPTAKGIHVTMEYGDGMAKSISQCNNLEEAKYDCIHQFMRYLEDAYGVPKIN